MWSWLRFLTPSPSGPEMDEEASKALAEAREANVEAQRKLYEAKQKGREVSAVANTARRIRAQNQFSARMRDAFGSRRHDQ